MKYVRILLYTLFTKQSGETCVITPFHWPEDWNVSRSNLQLFGFCILFSGMEITPSSPFYRWYNSSGKLGDVSKVTWWEMSQEAPPVLVKPTIRIRACWLPRRAGLCGDEGKGPLNAPNVCGHAPWWLGMVHVDAPCLFCCRGWYLTMEWNVFSLLTS